jgi:hypothetical protein
MEKSWVGIHYLLRVWQSVFRQACNNTSTHTPVSELSHAAFVCFVFFVSHVFICVTCLSKTVLIQQHSSQFQYEEWFLVICIQGPMSSVQTFVWQDRPVLSGILRFCACETVKETAGQSRFSFAISNKDDYNSCIQFTTLIFLGYVQTTSLSRHVALILTQCEMS